MAENYREQQQEEAEGIVDAGGFVNDPGTGMIAEDQETAAAADEQPSVPAQEPAQNDEEAISETEASENALVDLHEETGSGIDIAVVIIVLLIIIGCLSFGIANAPSEQQQIVAEQQAAQPTKAETKEPPFKVGELPEGIAVIVNGEEIPESTVTDYIAQFRKMYGLTSDADWSQWMASMSYTPETVRYETVQMYANYALVHQAIVEMGIPVTDEQVEEAYNETRSEYETDAEWEQALKETGLTEEEFREQCVREAEKAALMDYLGADAITQEEVDASALEYIKNFYTEYADISSLDEVSDEVKSSIREMVRYYAGQQAYLDYMAAAREEGDIVMAAMPQGLPYSENGLNYLLDSFLLQLQAQQAQQADQQ